MAYGFAVILIVVFHGLLLLGLRRQILGCGLVLLGGLLGGGFAFLSGWIYLKHNFKQPRPRNDSDWGDLTTPFVYLLVIPAVSMLLGVWLGIAGAYVIEREYPPEEKPSKPEPLDS